MKKAYTTQEIRIMAEESYHNDAASIIELMDDLEMNGTETVTPNLITELESYYGYDITALIKGAV